MVNNIEFTSSCLPVSRASNLSEDLEDGDELEGDDINKVPPLRVKDKKRRKNCMIRKMCGGVTVFILRLRNHNV
jgi:hypothetical protein